jgi:hypothetical protein
MQLAPEASRRLPAIEQVISNRPVRVNAPDTRLDAERYPLLAACA